MNLKLGGYELEAWRSGSGLGSLYSKLEMSALLVCAVLKNSYFRHCTIASMLVFPLNNLCGGFCQSRILRFNNHQQRCTPELL